MQYLDFRLQGLRVYGSLELRDSHRRQGVAPLLGLSALIEP